MPAELRPLPLAASARHLGIDPFELVRLAVASGTPLPRLELSTETLDLVASFGGLETWWPDGMPDLPKDGTRKRAALRRVLARLVSENLVGARTVRTDNVFRGLDPADGAAVQDALDVLVEAGLLVQGADVTGQQLAIADDGGKALAAVRKIADGDAGPPELARVLS